MLEQIKVKTLTKEQIIISVDRLTRFKETEIKYLRVFKDIITNNIIFPKYKKSELDVLDYEELKNLAEYAVNYSLKSLTKNIDDKLNNYLINQRLYDYEKSLFKIDTETEKLIKNKINYNAAISLLQGDIPLNLKWLKILNCSFDLRKERYSKGLRFPIEKIVLTEGITEEILLPEFAKLCGYDFDQNGVHIISAGGKNQVVKYFYKFAEKLKVPIFVLLDNDAKENLEEIKPKLRSYDKIHLLECGEFEDSLPHSLIERTINYSLKYISLVSPEELNQKGPMVKLLEELFKHKGLHEFKKSDFAQSVKANILSKEDASGEIKNIIEQISCIDNYNKKGTVVPS